MRYGKYLTILVLLGVVAAQVWDEVQNFTAFRVEHPGAGVGAFLIERAPYHLTMAAIVVCIAALAAWAWRKLPAADADMTEFHESGG